MSSGLLTVDGNAVVDDAAVVDALAKIQDDVPRLTVVILADPATPTTRVAELEHRLERDTGLGVVAFSVEIGGGAGAEDAARGFAMTSPPIPEKRGLWRCVYPTRARESGERDLVSVVRVQVDAHGAPKKVWILKDPGHDAGLAAVACAMLHRYIPATHAGRTVDGVTPPIQAHFFR